MADRNGRAFEGRLEGLGNKLEGVTQALFFASRVHHPYPRGDGKRPVVRLELAMSVEKHFTHDYITSHTMKSYHHTIVLYIRENYDDDDRIES